MAGLRMDLEAFGDVEISRQFVATGAMLRDPRPAFHEIADNLIEAERKQFASEGQYASGGWSPLAPSTRAQKQALGLDNGILDRTGALRRSLSERGAPGQTLRITRDSLTFGSTIAYGLYHQQGAGVPMRKPFELTEADRKMPFRVMQRRIMETVA